MCDADSVAWRACIMMSSIKIFDDKKQISFLTDTFQQCLLSLAVAPVSVEGSGTRSKKERSKPVLVWLRSSV